MNIYLCEVEKCGNRTYVLAEDIEKAIVQFAYRFGYYPDGTHRIDQESDMIIINNKLIRDWEEYRT